ncbi:MAG TPA: type II secretion system F family protein [Gemmataceae bacterium]|nr:type II secretion system F family protein [Gemmataceae bacterium]
MGVDDWFLSHARVSSRPHRRVRLDDKLTFFQQLSTLVASGTPLLQAIRVCADENQSIRMQQTLRGIAARVAAGSALHAAAGQYGDIFDRHWVEVIRTGEITGQMATVLQELARQVRESRETRRKVIGALIYPAVLVVVSIVAMTIMLWFVVPTFATMFHDMGAKLPAITQFVVDASDFLVDYGLYIVGLAVLFGSMFRRYARTERGRRRLSSVGLAIPGVGELLVQMAMYRFSSNLALLLRSGVPMLETLNALAGVFHTSPLYRDALTRAQVRVAGGRQLAVSLEESGLFTSMMVNMVRTGEESGQLAGVMEQTAPYYREKMEAILARATKLLEPMIIVTMGSAVAGLMLAIYLPMFEMAGKIH